MAEEAWGIWGANDEAVAPNLIGTAQVQRAAGLARRGPFIALAQRIHARMPMPMPDHRPGFMHFMGRDGGDYAAGAKQPGGFPFAEDTVVLPMHSGTHLDAPCHARCGDKLYNGFPGSSIRSTTGAQRLGIEKLPPLVTRGLLLDFATDAPLADGTPIGCALLEAACAAPA